MDFKKLFTKEYRYNDTLGLAKFLEEFGKLSFSKIIKELSEYGSYEGEWKVINIDDYKITYKINKVGIINYPIETDKKNVVHFKGLGKVMYGCYIYPHVKVDLDRSGSCISVSVDNQGCRQDDLNTVRTVLGDRVSDIGLIAYWDELIASIENILRKGLTEKGIIVTYPIEGAYKAISNILRNLLSEEGKAFVKERKVREDVTSLMNTYIEIK